MTATCTANLFYIEHGFLKVASFAWKCAEYGRLAPKTSNLFIVRHKFPYLSTDFEKTIILKMTEVGKNNQHQPSDFGFVSQVIDHAIFIIVLHSG